MKYIIKKFFSMIVTLVVVSFCVFLAFNVIPGDPALRKLGTEASQELIEQTRQQMGLNDPLLVRYARWFVAFLHGDMGTSYNYNVPVAGMIIDKIPITLTMAIMSFLLTILVSIPLGITTAKHENGLLDKTITITNQIIMAIPPFFSGILITFIFGMIFPGSCIPVGSRCPPGPPGTGPLPRRCRSGSPGRFFRSQSPPFPAFPA